MHTIKRTNVFALLNILFGVIGWFASFKLLTEYIHSIKNENYEPGCNISILVTCGPNMDSWQGSILGFSNTIIGVTLFVIPIIIGVALLFGAKMQPLFWIIYSIGMTLALSFVLWLSYQSIFSLGTLCPWCMIVWTITIPLVFFVYSYTSASVQDQKDHLRKTTHKMNIIVPLLFAFITIISIAFIAQIQLDWIAEIRRNI